MKVLVYGTLRPGHGAHRIFSNPRDLGIRLIPGTMYDLGHFPGVKLGGPRRFVANLIECDDNCLDRLDGYEGVPHLYTRQTINLEEEGLAYIYEINGPARWPIVEIGDWTTRREALVG